MYMSNNTYPGNGNKAKYSKTMCIFDELYCIMMIDVGMWSVIDHTGSSTIE